MNKDTRLLVSRAARGATLALLLCTKPAQAALVSMESDTLSGTQLLDFEAQTLDGKIIRSADLHGHAMVVNFLASWCPVCQAENQDLRKLRAAWEGRGVRFLGVLVDPVETPDTVEAARQAFGSNPLPYPVLLMNDSLRQTFQYQGFPATYFIQGDGTFTTTLLGYHPLERLASLTAQLQTLPIGTAAASPESQATPPSPSAHHPWDASPGLALIPSGWKQWHPLVIHFPVVLLLFEAAVVLVFWRSPTEENRRLSHLLLWLAALSFVPAVYTGLHDVGAALGPGWALWNGLRDRVSHFLMMRSSVSLHVLLAVLCALITTLRLVWRIRAGERVLRGRQGLAFLILMAVGLWMLLGAGQVGGGLLHR